MTVVAEKKMEEKSSLLQVAPAQYGCEILLEKATLQQLKDPSYPIDAYIVSYTLDGETHMDLCRGGKRVSVFDLYYDKYGAGTIQSIEWGYGKVSPRLWGYKAPEKKKRK
jgi:hypothetical protein